MRLDHLAGACVAVWGAGREGRAAVEALPPDAALTIVDDRPDSEAVRALASARRASVRRPAELLDGPGVDLVVRSAGVSVHGPVMRALIAAGVPVTSLLDLWLRHGAPATVVAITGTKGKSTTSLLVHGLLEAAGVRAGLAGNIGVPVSQMPACDVAVVEVSSYQAADLTRSPTIGVLTNLGVDHLPWHDGRVEQYWTDKLNLFAHDGLRTLLLGVDELPAPVPVEPARCRWPREADLVVRGGVLERSATPLVDLRDTPLAPDHLAGNLALAGRAAEAALGRPLTEDECAVAVAAFRLPPGRLEVVAERDGVRWVNDVLASNPFAAAASLRAHADRPVLLVAGGDDRSVEPDELIAAIAAHGRVRAVYAMGPAGRRWQAALAEVAEVSVLDDDDVAAAAAMAGARARSGDVVLFAPGAPTTPAVGDWEVRGAAFRAAAHRR
jgi:UDP-N-acetylmuramoylalanine--D-glutamate ligase